MVRFRLKGKLQNDSLSSTFAPGGGVGRGGRRRPRRGKFFDAPDFIFAAAKLNSPPCGQRLDVISSCDGGHTSRWCLSLTILADGSARPARFEMNSNRACLKVCLKTTSAFFRRPPARGSKLSSAIFAAARRRVSRWTKCRRFFLQKARAASDLYFLHRRLTAFIAGVKLSGH
jgi:hypothetical protein